MGLQPFYGKGPHPLLWAGSQAACGKITVNDLPNRLNYCVIFIMYTQVTNMAAGRIIQPGRLHAARVLRVGDPWFIISLRSGCILNAASFEFCSTLHQRVVLSVPPSLLVLSRYCQSSVLSCPTCVQRCSHLSLCSTCHDSCYAQRHDKRDIL
jgi:hypothetical protein